MASVQQRNGNGERRVADLVGKRAFLYGRVSSRQQAEEGYSLADQRDLVRAEAERLRVVVAGESFEQGSGQNWELQGFVELEKIVRRGGVDVVIVKNSSRLSRKTTKAAYIEFILERQGARLHYVEQDFDDSAAGRFARNVLRDAAEFYVDLQRELSMAGAARKVTGGEVNGHGPRPYGWQRVCDPRSGRTVGLEHDPAEAAILRRICAELLGRSYAEVCARLNAEGIPPPGKGQSTKRRKRNPVWTVPMMARQLSNPLLWGEYQFRRFRVVERGASKKVVAGDPDEVITVHLPPIVALEEIQRVQAAIAERKSKRRGRIPVEDDPFLLRGLLRCGDCGGALATRTAIVNGTRYR